MLEKIGGAISSALNTEAKLRRRIRELWHQIEEDNPNISTEKLMQMTCDRFEAETGKTIDHGDVANAFGP